MADDDSRPHDLGPWDPGEMCKTGIGACSLPPRKRLLAGLKQSGWLSSWQRPSGLMEEIQLEVDLGESVSSEGDCAAESGEGDNLESSDSDKSNTPCKRQKYLAVLADCPTSAKKSLPDAALKLAGAQTKSSKKTGRIKPAVSSIMASKAIIQEDISGVPSYKEIINAAKATAALAAKTAAETKAIAAAKAEAAAKAAAIAKAALDAIAISTEDMPKPTENCLSSSKGKKRGSTIKRKGQTNTKLSTPSCPRVDEGKIAPDSTSLTDDEELARQLHRAMNSSPRISRNILLLGSLKKCEKSPLSTEGILECKLIQTSERYSTPHKKKKAVKTKQKICITGTRTRTGRTDVKLKSMSAINETLNLLQGTGLSQFNVQCGTISQSPTSHGYRSVFGAGSGVDSTELDKCVKQLHNLQSSPDTPELRNDSVNNSLKSCEQYKKSGIKLEYKSIDDIVDMQKGQRGDSNKMKSVKDVCVNNTDILPCNQLNSSSDNIESILVDLQLFRSYNSEIIPDEKHESLSDNNYVHTTNASSSSNAGVAENIQIETSMSKEFEQSKSCISSKMSVPKTFSPSLHGERETRKEQLLTELSNGLPVANHTFDGSKSLFAYMPSPAMT